MQFFSDEYLMHYGIKGMKWKKKKNKTPAEYLDEAYDSLGKEYDARSPRDVTKKLGRDLHRAAIRGEAYTYGTGNNTVTHFPGAVEQRAAHEAERRADKARSKDLRKARKKAYKKNQRRIAKQQRKAKVNNALKRVKNKVFVDTSGSEKIGNHLYVEHH